MAVQLDARAFKALSSPTRISLLKKLHVKPRSLSSLAEECGLSVQATDEHIHKLLDAGLVEKDKKSKWAYYRLTAAGRSLVQPDRQPVYLMLAVSMMLLLAAAITWTQADAMPVPVFDSAGASQIRSAEAPAAQESAKALVTATDANATAAQPAFGVPSQDSDTTPAMAQSVPEPTYGPAILVQSAAMPWVYLFAAAGALSLAIAIHWWRRNGA